MSDKLEEMQKIYESISQPLTRDAQGLINELDYRCQWLSRSSELLADAQHELDVAMGTVAEQLDNKVSWNTNKLIVKKETADYAKVVSLAERLNATLTHQIDAIRSILSFEKESMRNTR